jgi:tripartite-type tricarboxylate transporter receptor subunit TctC
MWRSAVARKERSVFRGAVPGMHFNSSGPHISHAQLVRHTLPATLLLCAALAPAQDTTPARPKQIHLVVAAAPGTGPDYISRLISPALGEALRATVIVENRGGSNGIVGTVYAARAPADGSVLTMGNAGTHAVNAALYQKLPYDPVQDFAPISELASVSLALIVHPSVPAKSLRELITLAKKSPGKLNVAVAGASGELMGNALKLQADIDMKNIPYKGGSQAAIAVLSGEADMVFTSAFIVIEQFKAGRVKILGVSGAQRLALLPDVPTIAEGGLPGYEYEQWYAMFAPAKTPAAFVQAVAAEATRIVNIPDNTKKLVATGHRVIAGTPQQLADKIKREIARTQQIMLASGMPQQ